MLSLFSWRIIWSRLGLALLAALVLGLLLGIPGWLLFATTGGILAWHYLNLYRLVTWLEGSHRLHPPQAGGSWRAIFDGIYHLQKVNRRRRQELIRMLRRFRQGVEAMPDGVVVLHQDLHIDWCNVRSQHLLGLRWPNDANLRLDHLLRQPAYLKYLRGARDGEPIILPSPANDERSLELQLIAYDNQWLLIVRDVTQRLRLEQMRRDFVANVSHELRTPLTVVHGYLEMMEAMPQIRDDPMMEKAWQSMSQQTTRMKQLVDDLLTLSRIESDDSSRDDADIDIPAMLRGMLDEAKVLSNGAHQIQLDVQPDLQMYGSAEQMRSAMINLISNAVKYTPAGTEIRISWKAARTGGARFAVEDNGDGIAPEHLTRLTERFYRIDRARSRESGGTGLGLAIVKHALHNHDAELHIESVLQQGSTFSFVIPAQRIVFQNVSAAST